MRMNPLILIGAVAIVAAAAFIAPQSGRASHNAQHPFTIQDACEGYVEGGHFSSLGECMKMASENQNEFCVTLENRGGFKNNPDKNYKSVGECVRHIRSLPNR